MNPVPVQQVTNDAEAIALVRFAASDPYTVVAVIPLPDNQFGGLMVAINSVPADQAESLCIELATMQVLVDIESSDPNNITVRSGWYCYVQPTGDVTIYMRTGDADRMDANEVPW